VPRVSRSVPNDIRATIVRIFAYMGALAILAIAAASFFEPPAGVAAIEPAPRPQWVNVERPHPAFELVMPELGVSAPDYVIQRRSADGARKDLLIWGDAAAAGPYVTVEIYRPVSDSESFIDAPSEIAARIIAFTVTDDVKVAGTIDSKFGAMALVDFAIAAQSAHKGARQDMQKDAQQDVRNGRTRRCLGFVHPFAEPLMQISGWYCSAGEEVVDRATLACLLDRLTIISAGGDPALAGLFARAEIKRNFCGQRSPILAATPEHDAQVAIPRSVKTGVKLRGRLLTQQ
jgi:hypothetical protein